MSNGLIAAAGGLALLAPIHADAATRAWPASISAVYVVNVAGFDLGKFNFRSSIEAQTYRLSGDSELSWGFGLFKWSASTSSFGTLSGDQIQPKAYIFDFRSNQKAGSVKLSFDGGSVKSVSIVPPSSDDEGRIPLRRQHLNAVFDPMSALIFLSRGSGGNPCGKRIAVFDGQQRFDLLLSFRRQQHVKEERPSGLPTLTYVCGVRYVPVAGYKPNSETKALADATGIEVALRPVPAANIVLPIKVTIPTLVGEVSIAARTVDIVGPDNGRIALSH
ncbi:MAG: DUF3108 domain-containing protein [Hyphomicrobiaceae bacterium]